MRGDRRARAAVRRRHLHAHRLRVARRRGQPRGAALLRRRRGLLAQALCDLGPAGRAAAGADRLVDHRRARRSAASCRRCFPARRPTRWPSSRGKLGLRRGRLHADPRATTTPPAASARFDHTVLDDCHTEGLTPAKTHWARPIDTPPFYGYALRPGITFTYLGLKVDETRGRALRRRAEPEPVRGRRDDGRQRARQGLHRRRRHDASAPRSAASPARRRPRQPRRSEGRRHAAA